MKKNQVLLFIFLFILITVTSLSALDVFYISQEEIELGESFGLRIKFNESLPVIPIVKIFKDLSSWDLNDGEWPFNEAWGYFDISEYDFYSSPQVITISTQENMGIDDTPFTTGVYYFMIHYEDDICDPKWASIYVGPVVEPKGKIKVLSDTVHSGEPTAIEISEHTGYRICTQIYIFKDPQEQIILTNSWNFKESDLLFNINEQIKERLPYTPIIIQFDTLNLRPGKYYFVTYFIGYKKIFDVLEVLPPLETPLNLIRNNMKVNDYLYAVYRKDGSFLNCYGENIHSYHMFMGEVYHVAVDLEKIPRFLNQIKIVFRSSDNKKTLSDNYMNLKIMRDLEYGVTCVTEPGCEGIMVDTSEYQDRIAIIPFRTPEHIKYIEQDGIYSFDLRCSEKDMHSPCEMTNHYLHIRIDDDSAEAPFPTYAEYSKQQYGDSIDYQKKPLYNAPIKIVRIGDIGLTDLNTLNDFSSKILQYFSFATKGYFQLENVDTPKYFSPITEYTDYAPYDSTIQPTILKWYDQVPKTPGKPILNLYNSKEMYFGYLQYFYDQGMEEHKKFLTSVYPPFSGNEEITAYLADYTDGSEYGSAFGNERFLRVKIAELDPLDVHTDHQSMNGEDIQTYHFDPVSITGDNSVDAYIDYLIGCQNINQKMNTLIHELGHVYWKKPLDGEKLLDIPVYYYPHGGDWVYQDVSYHFYTRNEYMSNKRDRTLLDGITYGDANIERMVFFFEKPTVSIMIPGAKECIKDPNSSLPYDPHKDHATDIGVSLVVPTNQTVAFRIQARANAGLKNFAYLQISGPKIDDPKRPEAGRVMNYDETILEQRNDILYLRFNFLKPGIYQYVTWARSRLYGKENVFPYGQSDSVYFTFFVGYEEADLNKIVSP